MSRRKTAPVWNLAVEMMKNVEFDLRVWKKRAADEAEFDLYTVSVGRRGVIIDASLEAALDAIRRELKTDGGGNET